MKKTMFFSCLFTMYCVLASCSSDDLDFPVKETTCLQQKRRGEAEALDAWSKLKNTFGYSRTATDCINYPNYYGGSYVEDGKLIVYIVKEKKDSIPRFLHSDSTFVVKECEYSYNELLKTTNDISEFMVSDKNNGNPIKENLSLCTLCETINRVEVYVTELTTTFISEFKKQVSSSPAIKFIIAPKITDYENKIPSPIIINEEAQPLGITYINPGDFIFLSNPSSTGSNEASVGYKAINDYGVIGFLTASHAGKINDEVAWGSRVEAKKIGKVIDSMYSGCIDAAFCQITNSYFDIHSRSQSIAYKNSQLKEGVVLHMEGGYNQSVGTIRSLNTSTTKLRGLISAYYTSQHGDSGGYVYYKDPYGNELTAGINQGHALVQNPDGIYVNVGLCCAAEEIKKEMGLTPCQ